MKIHLVTVGTKMPRWVQDGYNEYAKRLPRDISPHLIELPLGARGKNSNVAVAKKMEGQSMLAAMDAFGGDTLIVALDVLGKSLSTEMLATKMDTCQMEGQSLCLLVGGPDGLAQECLQRADEKWSLSALTLPHPLVRVVLIEQLYRAWTILHNHPYHK